MTQEGAAAVAAPTGLRVRPFRGVRFDPDRVADLAAVTAPPYDVVDVDGVLRLERLDAHNVVRLVLPRAPGPDPDARYVRARTTLDDWLSTGVLRQDEVASLYVYEQTFGRVRQRGVVGAVDLDSALLPHEGTRSDVVDDRAALMATTQAQAEPILLAHDGSPATGARIEEALEAVVAQQPLVDAMGGRGSRRARQRLWQVADPATVRVLTDAFEQRTALIADGHHRFEAYRRLRDSHRQLPGTASGLALLVDATRHRLRLRAIHRSVAGRTFPQLHDAAAGTAAALGLRLREGEPPQVRAELGARASTGRWAVGVVGHGHAVVLEPVGGRAAPDELVEEVLRRTSGRAAQHRTPPVASVARGSLRPPRAYGQLVTAGLHDVLLPSWGVDALAGEVDYHHEPGQALRSVRASGGVALLLPAMELAQVLAVAQAGWLLPRKSTSFGPKPRTGLVMRLLTGP